jgi:hypothetical protein
MSQNQSVELSAFFPIMQGRNLICCQIVRKARGNREDGERERERKRKIYANMNNTT